MSDDVQLSEEEHFLSAVEVTLQRGLEEEYDQEADRRLLNYCAAAQNLVYAVP